MPNHVYSFMTITGTKAAINKFAKKHFSDGQLDFNTFIEQPAALINTTSPSNPPRPFVEVDPSELTNKTKRAEYKVAKAKHQDEVDAWHENSKQLITDHGYDNWYDWRIENWGTKWNSYDGEMDIPADGIIECNFQTAWGLPLAIFHRIGRMYPKLNVHIETVEEGGWFGGIVTIAKGAVVDKTSQEEWKEYAEKLLGWTDDEEAEIAERIHLALGELKRGKVTDQGVTNIMANFIKDNMDEFIEYSK